MIKIRRATIRDLYLIRNFNQELFNDSKRFDKILNLRRPDKNLKYYGSKIKGKNSVAFISEVRDKPVGYLIGSIAKVESYRTFKKMAEAENMFILSEYRKKEIGKKLMQAFIAWAKSKKVKNIKVSIYEKNDSSINFHKKMGFSDYFKTMEAKI